MNSSGALSPSGDSRIGLWWLVLLQAEAPSQGVSLPIGWAFPGLLVALVFDGLVKQAWNFAPASYVPLGAMIAICVLVGFSARGIANPHPIMVLAAVALAVWTVVEILNPFGPWQSTAFVVLFARLVPITSLWWAPRLLDSERRLRTAFLLISILSLATAVFGLIEYSLGPVVVAEWGPGFNPFRSGNPWFSRATHHLVLRPYSFFTAPALAAEFCTCSVIPAGWLVLRSGRLYPRVIGATCLVACSAFVLLSGVRLVSLQLGVMLRWWPCSA
jgi:hypothetical protein